MDPRFDHDVYTIRRKLLKIFGAAFHVFDPQGNLVFFSELKAFKLKEDVRVYTGENMATELLRISARQILDFGAAYDIVDATTGEKVGAVKRRGWKSLVRDQWILLNASDEEIGAVREDKTSLAVLRRILGNAASLIAPQRYDFVIGEIAVGRGTQNRNPFLYKVTLDLTPDTGRSLDRRLALAVGLLLGAIEGKQG